VLCIHIDENINFVMSLIIFLFKVSNLELSKATKSDAFNDDQDSLTDTINEETLLFCAKMSFRGRFFSLQSKTTNKYIFFSSLQESIFGQTMFQYKMERPVLLPVEINQRNLILI
jgi:hypothetical protein